MGHLRRGLGMLVQTLFSFETTFVLFLFAGIYKADPRLAWMPIDLTALFAAVSLVSGLTVLITRHFKLPTHGLTLIALAVLFAAYMTVSLAWSPSHHYGSSKALYTGTLLLWALAGAALVIAPEIARIKRISLVLRVFAALVAWQAVLVLTTWSSGAALRALGGNYLGLGRVVGIGAILCLSSALWPSIHLSWRLVNGALFVVMAVLMLLIGARGPLLALVAAVSIPIVVGTRLSRSHIVVLRRQALWMLIAASGVIVAIGYSVWGGNQTFATIRRLEVLLTPGGGASAFARVQNYDDAVQQWMIRPVIGNGVGSWPVLARHADVRDYPHNIFLETLAELGLLGFTLLLIIIGYGAWRLVGNRRFVADPTSVMLAMLLLNALLNAMVSGDLTDNRFVFTVLGLVAGTRPWERSHNA